MKIIAKKHVSDTDGKVRYLIYLGPGRDMFVSHYALILPDDDSVNEVLRMQEVSCTLWESLPTVTLEIQEDK